MEQGANPSQCTRTRRLSSRRFRKVVPADILLWGVSVCLACTCRPARAQPWLVPGAQNRIRIERDPKAERPADTGQVRLYPHAEEAGKVKIRLFTGSGVPVGYEVLWSAQGDPPKLLFDTSHGESPILAYLGGQTTNVPPRWESSAGVVLETRPYKAEEAGSWKDPRTLWTRPAEVLGRSLVREIHHGIHLHGPTRDFMSYYKGYLTIGAAGEYGFATMSDDASFLLINGHTVAAWPGLHNVHGGRRAQHRGRVRLKRGRQKIEYFNVQDGAEFSVTAAWQPPGKKHFQPIPEAAFVPITRWQVTRFETRPGLPTDIGFTWNMISHAMVDDMALVNVEFNVVAPESKRTFRWTFDDGTQAQGSEVHHCLPRAGIRTVELEMLDGGRRTARCARQIRVHPRWPQRNLWPPPVFQKQKADLMARDLSRTPVHDLAYVVKLAERIEDRALLNVLGVACLKRRKDFTSETADVFYRLGFHFQHAQVRRYDLAEQALRQALALSEEGSSLRQQAGLHLAGFLVHCREQADVGRHLLESLDAAKLSAADARLRRIFEGDALLCLGHAGAARRAYAAVGPPAEADDHEPSLRRRARLETAKDYVGRGEFDAAERLVREIEWESPVTRVDTETGLVMIQAHIGRKEYPFAVAHCRRLLHAAPMDTHRPQVLLKLVESALGLGHREQAQEALDKLLQEHPYSEAAARAKDRWQDGLPLKP